jgi:hypothetical protein
LYQANPQGVLAGFGSGVIVRFESSCIAFFMLLFKLLLVGCDQGVPVQLPETPEITSKHMHCVGPHAAMPDA